MSPSFLFPGDGRPFDEIVDAYVAEYAGESSSDEDWARFHVSNLVFDAARVEEAWPIIVAAIDRAGDDGLRRSLGAGDLETLITFHGPQFIDRIEQAARTSAEFHTALSEVSATYAEVWPRIQAVRSEAG